MNLPQAHGRVCERCGDAFVFVGLGIIERLYLCFPCHFGSPPEYRGPLGIISGSG